MANKSVNSAKDPSATYKLWVHFKNGKVRSFKSLDFRGTTKMRDEQLGLQRLRKLIKKCDPFWKAQIYNRQSNILIEEYDEYGNLVKR